MELLGVLAWVGAGREALDPAGAAGVRAEPAFRRVEDSRIVELVARIRPGGVVEVAQQPGQLNYVTGDGAGRHPPGIDAELGGIRDAEAGVGVDDEAVGVGGQMVVGEGLAEYAASVAVGLDVKPGVRAHMEAEPLDKFRQRLGGGDRPPGRGRC